METLEKINELIKSCLLPELKNDLDNIQINREHFKDYHQYLEMHLPLLYDFVQQQQNNLVWTGEESNKLKQEIQAYLLVLLFEISFPDTIFELNHSELIENSKRILQNTVELPEEVNELIIKYYEDNLHKSKWKRQLGAIHGFVNYLKFCYKNSSDHGRKMSPKMLMFSLSVALNIRTAFETHYKTLSTSIFLVMLESGTNDAIISMNIHSVIYDTVFKDVHITDSIHFINKQWNCLIKCLDYYKNFDSFTWNYLDDMMETLLRYITLAPDNAASMCLLKFVNKLIVYFTINHKEFEDFFNKDLSEIENINEFRSLGQTNTSYTCYRWAKSILHMFILESHKLMQPPKMAKLMLQEIHKIYILAILPIGLNIIEPHLTAYLNKFMSVIMEAVKEHKNRKDVMHEITSLLETFNYQLQNSDDSVKLQTFKQNLCGLLKTDAFRNYVSL